MEFGSIEREIYIDASPEIVFEVISRPEHVREWWEVETDLSPTPGDVSQLAWGRETAEPNVEQLRVVEVDPPRRFSFRWIYDEGADATTDTRALLVTFELTPSGTGTTLHLTETGFREKGWEAAVLEAMYADHVHGWDTYVPAIAAYATRLAATR